MIIVEKIGEIHFCLKFFLWPLSSWQSDTTRKLFAVRRTRTCFDELFFKYHLVNGSWTYKPRVRTCNYHHENSQNSNITECPSTLHSWGDSWVTSCLFSKSFQGCPEFAPKAGVLNLDRSQEYFDELDGGKYLHLYFYQYNWNSALLPNMNSGSKSQS